MVRTRSGWLVALVALGLGAGACKNKDGTTAQPGTTANTAAPGTPGEALGGKAPAAVAGSDDLSLLPAESEVVLGLNFAQLRQSALWKQFEPKLMEMAAKGLADFKATCGFDPMEAVQSLSMGLKNLDGDTPDGVIVMHGPEKAKLMGCMDKAKAEAAKNGAELTVDGDVVTIKDKSGETMAWTYVDNDTVVGVLGPAASKDAVLAAAKGGSALKTSATFVEMYGKINTKESLWFLVNGNASFMAKAAQAGVKPKAVFGSINVTDGLSLDMRVRVASADEATQLVQLAKGQTDSPQVKQMFDKLDITADGPDAKFGVAMSNQKLQQLMTMVGGMMGGLMGGM